MSLALDTRDITDALLFVEKEVGRDCADSMNRAGLHTIIGSGSYPGAMQLTKKADKANIAQVTDNQLRKFVITKAKRKGTYFQMTNRQIQLAVNRERARRNSAVGYTAYAGWNKAAQAVGGRGAGKGINKDFERSIAAKGFGKKATKANIEAVIANVAPMAEVLGFDALQEGLDNAAKDLVDYAHKRMQKSLDKVKKH